MNPQDRSYHRLLLTGVHAKLPLLLAFLLTESTKFKKKKKRNCKFTVADSNCQNYGGCMKHAFLLWGPAQENSTLLRFCSFLGHSRKDTEFRGDGVLSLWDNCFPLNAAHLIVYGGTTVQFNISVESPDLIFKLKFESQKIPSWQAGSVYWFCSFDPKSSRSWSLRGVRSLNFVLVN